MLMYFFLSGAHRTLPYSELKALAEAEVGGLKSVVELDQVVIADSSPELADVLRSRSVLVKYGGQLLAVAEVAEGVERLLNSLVDSDICSLGGFSHVAFKRVKKYGERVRYRDVVFKLIDSGSRLCRSAEAPILDVIVSEGLIISGLRLFTRDLRSLRLRDPQRRPVYRPGTLTPEISRLLVNLARVSSRRKELFLDPFSGVGGLLLEACDMGLKYAGSDIDSVSVRGAKENLVHYGCFPNVVVADACASPFRSADGVGTDPPYGRLTQSKGRGLEELMDCFLNSMSGVLKSGRYLVFAQKAEVDVEDYVFSHGFRIVERHLNWVHGALTRDIYVVRKG
jgi:tRNA (guanine10-N2)-dimethyltransferase